MPSLSDVMQDAINEQIGNEMHASYSYLAMSAWLSHEEFAGSAAWMRAQSQEENAHAMKLFDFVIARGGRINLRPIAQPNQEFKSVRDVFERALDQEQGVTVQIEKLYELAFNEKAFAALVELEWFIREQVEEEATLREIVHKFKLIGDDGASLLDLDRELAGRQPEAAAAE